MPVDAGNRLTEAHRLAQARLGVATVQDMVAVWRLLDPRDLDATTARWLRVARRVIDSRHRQSTTLAANYMRAFRAVELGGAERFSLMLADALPVEQVATVLTATGPAALKAATARGLTLTDATSRAFTTMAGEAQRLALDGGRSTITATIDADPKALGWARATSGRPCAFCAMLAGRGPVYKGAGTADFKPHGSCHCVPKPVYREDAPWPLGSRRFAELWDEHAKGEADQLNAFRRAYEAQHPDFRDARNARRRELYARRREASSST